MNLVQPWGVRKLRDVVMRGALTFSAFIVSGTMVLILGYLVYKGFPALNLDFFTSTPKPTGEDGGGMSNGIIGTLMLVSSAMFLSFAPAILVGTYLAEYPEQRLAKFVRGAVDILASTPSIVIGLFGYAVFVKPVKHFSAMAGSFVLCLIIAPIIIRTSEEIIKLVPRTVHEAGLALGLPRWKVLTFIVWRSSFKGILTGVLLAMARAAGETAPLIFTAFGNPNTSMSFLEPIAALPIQIYTYATSPFDDWQRQAWAAALVLVVFVLLLNGVIKFYTRAKTI